jgi:hypothetical protein
MALRRERYLYEIFKNRGQAVEAVIYGPGQRRWLLRRCRSRPWHPGGDPVPRSERHLRLLGRGVPGQDGQPYPTTDRGPRVRRDLSLKSEDAMVYLLLATLPPHAYVPEITILPAATQYGRPIRPSVIATTRPASHLARGGSLPEYRSLRSGGTRFCDAGTFRTRMARRHHLYPRVGNRCGSPEAARGQSC